AIKLGLVLWRKASVAVAGLPLPSRINVGGVRETVIQAFSAGLSPPLPDQGEDSGQDKARINVNYQQVEY
ncbi:MAG: hypothetical protein LBF95_04965, partial [Treponema sp.]|nr:hypothetical protein [Treponema sp.]